MAEHLPRAVPAQGVFHVKSVVASDQHFGYYEAHLAPGYRAMMFSSGDDPRCHDLLFARRFEPSSMRLVAALLGGGDCFVDVGAHTGTYSLLAAQLADVVVAIEPNPLSFARLVLHLGLNGLQNKAVPIHAAVGDRPGLLELSWGSTKGFGWLSSGTQTGVRTTHFSRTVAQSLPLDSLGLRAKARLFLKIDVEGSECGVVAGGAKVFATKPDFLIESFSADNCRAITQQLSPEYRYFRVHEEQLVLRETVGLEAADIKSGSFNSFASARFDEIEPELVEAGFVITRLSQS